MSQWRLSCAVASVLYALAALTAGSFGRSSVEIDPVEDFQRDQKAEHIQPGARSMGWIWSVYLPLPDFFAFLPHRVSHLNRQIRTEKKKNGDELKGIGILLVGDSSYSIRELHEREYLKQLELERQKRIKENREELDEIGRR